MTKSIPKSYTRASGVHARRQYGFSLIELMIALVLGLLVISGVGSVFIANKNAYRTNEGLSQLQDAARTAFELLARDIREAGLRPCGATKVDSVLNVSGTEKTANDWLNFEQPVVGYDNDTAVIGLPGTGEAGEPVGEDALMLGKAEDSDLGLEPLDSPRANIVLEASTDQIQAGDIVMVCDADKATIFQVTNYNDSNRIVVHNTGTETPGNQTKCLNHPVPQTTSGSKDDFGCTSLSTTAYLLVPRNAVWYIGKNSAGTNSLFRVEGNYTSSPSEAPDEMVRGVHGMQLTYHRTGRNDFETASQVEAAGSWNDVDAVRVQLSVRSLGLNPDNLELGTGTDRKPLERTFSTTVAIRNRLNN